jgi:hypothetical protein
MIKDDDQEYSPLIALYDHIHDEILRYRDMEWKICYWTILLQAGIIAAYKYISEIIQFKFTICYIFNSFILFISWYGAWHIYFAHDNLTKNRNMLKKIEGLLKLSEILPEKWREKKSHFWEATEHLMSWWICIFSVMIFELWIFNSRFGDIKPLLLSILTVSGLWLLIKFMKTIKIQR